MIGPITQSSGLLTENETVQILARTTGAGSKNKAKIELKYAKKANFV